MRDPMSRRDVLRMGLWALGAAMVAPVAGLPFTGSIVEEPPTAPASDDGDDLRTKLVKHRDHIQWLLDEGDRADETDEDVAAVIVENAERDLRETGEFSNPEALEYAVNLTTYLYGRRMAGLPAWPADGRSSFQHVIQFVDHVLARHAA